MTHWTPDTEYPPCPHCGCAMNENLFSDFAECFDSSEVRGMKCDVCGKELRAAFISSTKWRVWKTNSSSNWYEDDTDEDVLDNLTEENKKLKDTLRDLTGTIMFVNLPYPGLTYDFCKSLRDELGLDKP